MNLHASAPLHGAPGLTRRAALLWAALSTAAVAAQTEAQMEV